MSRKNVLQGILIFFLITNMLLLFVCSFVLVYKNKKPQEVEAASMNISNLSDLQSFMSKVRDDDAVDLNATLTADIDCGGAKFYPIGYGSDFEYEGTFDGAGFIISNFKIDTVYESTGGISGALGFFGTTNGATITRLKLEDINYSAGSSYDSTAVGGIVGNAIDTTISECEVENFTITNSGCNKFYAGGIAGFESHIREGCGISFCYVENFDLNGMCNRKVNAAAMFAVAGISSFADSVSRCVFVPAGCEWSLEYIKYDSTNNISLMAGGYKGSVSSDDGQYIKFDYHAVDGAINCVANSHSSATAVISTYMSTTGGLDVKTGKGDYAPWYSNISYNSFPQLRVFIDWIEYVVVSSDTSIGTITGTSPKILPADFTVNPTLTSSELVLGGSTYSVNVINSEYDFEKWEREGVVFTAKFKGKAATLKFNAVNNAILNSNNTAVEYKIGLTSSVSVSTKSNSNGKTYTITFSFTEYGKSGTTSVTYTTAEGCYVKNKGISKTSSFAAGEVIQVTPVISAKKFGIEFI